MLKQKQILVFAGAVMLRIWCSHSHRLQHIRRRI